MKTTYTWRIVLLLSAIFALGACGGTSSGPGGGGGGGLATGGFIKTYAPDVATVGWLSPFATGTRHYLIIYQANNVNGSGVLNSISFRLDNAVATAISCPDTTIRVGHTLSTEFATGTDLYAAHVENGRGSMVTVINNSEVTVPVTASGDYFSIPFDATFAYNGVDNLAIEIIRPTACTGDVYFRAEFATAFFGILYNSDTASATGLVRDNDLFQTKFNFDGGDNYLDSAVGTIGNGNFYPFNNNAATGRKVQLLYLASDVNGSGPITGIGFPVGQLTTDQIYTVTIKLGHSALTELVTGPFADSYSSGPVTVATNLTFTVPAGIPQGDFIWLPVTGSFNYNGTDNLILEVETTDNSMATGDTRWWNRFSTGTNLRLYSDLGSVTGTATEDYYFTKFRFNGGTMDVMTDAGNAAYIVPVGDTGEFIIQLLYDSAALGTGGQITSLGFRLGADSNAFDHTDVNLVLGHTTLSSLGAVSLAANIESNRTAAFSGTISIPAGLKAGDWITVPLSTSFTYDPTMNLVVQWDVPGFATTHPGIGHTFDSGRYVGHVMGNLSDRTSDVGTSPGDFIIDMSLILNK